MINQTCWICTGRLGDILNLLPACKIESDNGNRIALMVSEEFAGILEGVLYVDPVVFKDHWLELPKAVDQAKAIYNDVRVCQVAGPRATVIAEAYDKAGMKLGDPMTESFCKEQWRICGHFPDFKRNLPLVFDNRNFEREMALMANIAPIPQRRHVILYHLGGSTSPYPYAEILKDYLSTKMHTRDSFHLDISGIRAERFYDLLALYEAADVLVAIDSAPLHLAQACPNLMVVALKQDSPGLWHGSPWRNNHIMNIRYSDLNLATQIPDRIKWQSRAGGRKRVEKPNGYHVYSLYFVSDKSLHTTAVRQWRRHVYPKTKWVSLPIDYRTFGRDGHTVFKKGEVFPFVKDVIRSASQMCKPDDFIVLTRPESNIRASMLSKLKSPCCANRMVITDESDVVNEKWTPHSANDLFYFTKKWWIEHQNDLPDFIMGTDPYWDRIMGEWIVKHGGERFEGICYRKRGPLVPIKDDGYRTYNEHLALTWMQANGITDEQPSISDQVSAVQINPLAIHKHGYNPSILPITNGQYLMAYRAHRWGDARTCIAMATLDSNFHVKRNIWFEPQRDGYSTEDPKLFWHRGNLYMSYVESNFPNKPLRSDVYYGAIVENDQGWKFGTHYGITPPNRQAIEKNWVFYSHEDRLYCIYAHSPWTVVWEVDRDQILRETNTKGFDWQWGPIRGGTGPVRVGGKLVRFFHSTTWKDFWPVRWRYWIGAMEWNPPNNLPLGKVASAPLLGATGKDELSTKTCRHFKPNVIFPGSCWLEDNTIHVAFGVNDSSCWVMRLKQEDLKL